MKIWVGLSLVMALIVVVCSLDFSTAPRGAGVVAAPVAVTAPAPVAVAAPAPVKAHPAAHPHKIHQARATRAESDEVLVDDPAKPAEVAAQPTEQIPDYLKSNQAPKAKPDPIMELRSSETVRPNDGPFLTVTYGDLPAPNFKVERRAWNMDTTGKTSEGAVAAGE